MLRGLFDNPAIRNKLDPAIPPGSTVHVPSGKTLPLWLAAEQYRKDGHSVVIVAGERYGTGSSRDWAAKGVALLGVRAVLARSFERIHRSNLVGMGILPLQLPQQIQVQAGDRIEIEAAPSLLTPRAPVAVTLHHAGGASTSFTATAAVETGLEVETLQTGGIIPFILRDALRRGAAIRSQRVSASSVADVRR
jgi:aconitate hydratase